MSASMPSFNLPADVLLLVCDALGPTHPPSLPAFALVCRKWTSVALIHLHRSVSFSVASKDDFEQHIHEFLRTGAQKDCLKHVQRLEIAGPGPYSNPEHVKAPAPGWRRAPYEDFGESLYEIGHGDTLFSIENRKGTVRIWEKVPDASWFPLARLLSQLSALADLAWNCAQDVPSCVMNALHEHAPRCRLWINTFQCGNLVKPSLAASEVQLLTSPCLHAVCARYITSGPSSDNTIAYHAYDEEVLQRVVAGMAPNLMRVVVSKVQPPAMANNVPKLPLQGLWSETKLPHFSMGHLSALKFEDPAGVAEITLDTWSRCTDFAVLRSLAFSTNCGKELYNRLSGFQFESLESLALAINRQNRTDEDLIEAVQRFLLSIHPLKSLLLKEQVHRLQLEPIFRLHGLALRHLWLLQSTTRDEEPKSWKDRYIDSSLVLQQLKQYCPTLQELAIPIRRSKGDEAEVEAHRMIGSLPMLNTLHLTLDCSDYSVLWAYEDPNDDGEGDWPDPPTDESFGQADIEAFPEKFFNQGLGVRNGHIRDAFINCMVDDNLARAIFCSIVSAKPIGSSTLEVMSIRTRGGAIFSIYQSTPSDVQQVVEILSRDWVVTQNVRDDRRGELFVEDITNHASERNLHTSLVLNKPILDVLQGIWPDVKEAQDLGTSKTRSFPLTT